jgi:hypothetical protein
VDGQRAVASPTRTLLGITGATTLRPWVYDFYLSASAVPADNSILWYIQRSTAAGTSTAVTPQALDQDPASTTALGFLCRCLLRFRLDARFVLLTLQLGLGLFTP